MQNCIDGSGVAWRPLRLLRMRLSQEDRARAEVITANLRQRERLGVAHVGIADDRHGVAVLLERAERVVRNQREVGPDLFGREQELGRRPVVATGEAMHLLDADEPRGRGCGRGLGEHAAGWHHRVQEGQRHCGPHATEEGPAGHVLSCDERHRLHLLDCEVSPPVAY
jgi:hypothetical protein